MKWVNFLHIYQPPLQSKDIIESVCNECYRPLFRGLLKISKFKINLNINACLTETLAKSGYEDIVDDIKELARQGKLEFTGSAHYHPLLPFLSKGDIARQIIENDKINKKYFGNVYKPHCFFPPEMAYSRKVAEVVSRLGYKMIMLDEISFDGGKTLPFRNRLFRIKDLDLTVVFRERRVSNCIMGALVRSQKEFKEVLAEEVEKDVYLCTGMDGETFGHHRPGLEASLFNIVSSGFPEQVFLSELPGIFEFGGEIEPKMSTWASSAQDIEKGIQFYSWRDPKNQVHKAQWKLFNYLMRLSRKRRYSWSVQRNINRAQSSDQFFWASGEPWWSVEMIEKGAWIMLKTLISLPGIKKSEIKKGEEYYRDILSSAFKWQRSGRIEEKEKKYKEAVRIPFKERTFEVNEEGKEVYKEIVSLIKKRMFEASKRQNYERAILWRDAIWKLEKKNDIYDLLHVVDLLRIELPEKFKKIDPKLNKLMAEYKRIKSGQPELRKA